MNQIPCVPMYNQMPQQYIPVQQPVQQPNYNAVKIDIINPTAGGPQPQYQPVTSPIYGYPTGSVYTNSTNAAPVQYPQPPVCVPQQPVFVPQQPVCIPQQPTATAPEASVAVTPEQPATVQVPQAPQVVEQQNINVAPQQPQQQPNVVPQPAQPTPAAEVPAPQVSAPEVVAPTTVEPKLDINSFVARLSNPDFDTQAAAMEDIATMIKDRKKTDNPETLQKARTLIDKKVYDELSNIISFDSSKLDGPTQPQIEARQKILKGEKVTPEEEKLANTMTAKEQAERNKSYALFTIAIMDDMYAEEVSKLPESSKPSLTDLPQANVLVDQLKDNANPMVRSSAIEALSYIQCPEYKKDLTTLFTVAKNDQDAGVAQSAAAALEKLNQIAA